MINAVCEEELEDLESNAKVDDDDGPIHGS